MKTCPYCAEDIKDAAIRCRYCLTWLVDDHPKDADSDTVPSSLAGRAGMGSSNDVPQATVAQPMTTEPIMSEPMTTPEPASTPEPMTTPEPMGAGPAAPSATAAAPSAAAASEAAAPAADTKIEFTHTGSRYLLGYGADYFGIWDRNAPQQPIERFPRNDQGWAAAWQRYAAIENNWMDLRTGQKSG